MPDPHLLTGAYALDALDDVERAAAERHLAGCADCRAEVESFREVGTWLAERVAEPPPSALRERVLAAARDTRQLPPAGHRPQSRRRSWPQPLAAAAAAVVLAAGAALGGLAWQADRRADQARLEATRISRVLADPARVERTARPSVGGSATVVAARGDAVFAARDLPAPPEGHDYQLWVGHDGRMTSVGVLDWEDGSAQAYVPDVGTDAVLAVSVEPDGGSEQPTTDPVVVVES